MSKKITIHWGTDKEPQDKKSYTFETEEQLKYFMMGVNEANGWLEYEVIDNIERINDEKTKIRADRHNNFLCKKI